MHRDGDIYIYPHDATEKSVHETPYSKYYWVWKNKIESYMILVACYGSTWGLSFPKLPGKPEHRTGKQHSQQFVESKCLKRDGLGTGGFLSWSEISSHFQPIEK